MSPGQSPILRTITRPAAPDTPPVHPANELTASVAGRSVSTRSLRSVFNGVHRQTDGSQHRSLPIPTGFEVLDYWIGNGLRQGELLLLGGAPGVGKTTFAIQIARNIAASGQANILYACYEHPGEYILNRLLVQETIEPRAQAQSQGLTLDDLTTMTAEVLAREDGTGLFDTVCAHPGGARAVSALDRYSDRFQIVANAARENGIDVLRSLVAGYRTRDDQPLVVFVDYLQKVEPRQRELRDEDERVTEVVQGLKQLALEYNVAVVAIAAAEKLGVRAPRLRFSHLRGSSALMYEADIAVIMNDKWQIIDRDHIVFNQHKAQQFRDWVVCTIEKNRSGRNLVEVEFMKRFEYCCFDPNGGRVTERLYEERIQGER